MAERPTLSPAQQLGQLNLKRLHASMRALELPLTAPSEALLTLLWQDYARPTLEALHARASKDEVCGRDLVTTEAIEQLLGPVFDPSPDTVKRLYGQLDEALLEELFAPVLQETLLAFAAQLVPGMQAQDSAPADGDAWEGFGARKRFRSFSDRVGQAAGRWADLTKSVAGTLGLDVEQRVKQLVTNLSGALFKLALRAVEERLRSEEGRRLLRQLRRIWVRTLLDAPLNEVLDDLVEDVDRAAREGLVPAIAAFGRVVTRDTEIQAELETSAAATHSLLTLLTHMLGSEAKAEGLLEALLNAAES